MAIRGVGFLPMSMTCGVGYSFRRIPSSGRTIAAHDRAGGKCAIGMRGDVKPALAGDGRRGRLALMDPLFPRPPSGRDNSFGALHSRRDFLAATAGLGLTAGLAFAPGRSRAQPAPAPPLVLWSEVCQELKLDYAATAEVVAEAGLEGIDCPLRPGGQVLPERVADDLPRLNAELTKRGLKLYLISTGIDNADSPHAERVLREAARFGVKHYRLAYWHYPGDRSPEAFRRELVPRVKALAAMNRALGLCGVIQNHAGGELVGAKITDAAEMLEGVSPDEMGLAFDIGHALRELGAGWRDAFLRVRPHVRVVYMRDCRQGGDYTGIGDGDVGKTDFFALLRAMNYRAPISYRLEYPWHAGRGRNRQTLLETMKREVPLIRSWLRK